MRSRHLSHLILAALLLPGCAHDVYQIEIVPDGDHFERTLTCWHVEDGDPPKFSPLEEEQLARIEAIYGNRKAIEDGKKHRFTGRFHGETPADVGGAGSYTHFTTPLGDLTYYVERFRGNDDLEADLADRRKAADQFADLALGWVEKELGDEPGFDGLRRFLDEDFRRDLKNVGIYAWTADACSMYDEESGPHFGVRVFQYLVERAYVTPRDAPTLFAFREDGGKPLAKLLQRIVLRKLGHPDGDPVPESLAWLGDPERLEASVNEYFRTTEVYRQRLAQWRKEHADKPDADPPSPSDMAGELLIEALVKSLEPAAADVVELTLATGIEPFLTNGQWDAASGKVTWSERLDEHRALPSLVFAAWSPPDRAAQTRHFGRVVLEGEGLSNYVLWYENLSPADARQWDGLIEKLSPEKDVPKALRSFRFASDPPLDPSLPEEEQPGSLADTPRELILEGLEKDSDSPQ